MKKIIQQQFYLDPDTNKFHLNRVETFDVVVGTRNYLYSVDKIGKRNYSEHIKVGTKRYQDHFKVVEPPLYWRN